MTSPSRLEIDYRSAHWVHRLLAEINRKPSLAAAHAQWASPQPGLADLAFSIDTRIGNLREIVRLTDENLHAIGKELEETTNLDEHIAGGYAYRVRDDAALRRALIGFNAFIAEARSLYENLARFYRVFLNHYFGEQVSEKAAYEAIAALRSSPQWATELQLLRHDILHYRSPWLRFDVGASSPRFDAVLMLDWRPGATGPDAEVPMSTLRDFRTHIVWAATALVDALIARVVVWP